MLYAFARSVADLVDFQSWQTVLHYGIRPLSDRDVPVFQRIVRFSLCLDILGGLAGGAVGLLVATFASGLLGWPSDIRTVGQIYCVAILFMASATPMGVLRVLNRFDLISVQGVTATAVRLVGTLALWVLHGGLYSMIAVWIVAECCASAVFLTQAWRVLAARNLTKGLLSHFNDTLRDVFLNHIGRDFPGIWRFAISTNLNSTLAQAFSHVGTLVVGSMLGPADAGYYRIANQVATGIAKPATLVQTTLYPEMARLWRDRATTRLYRLATQIALLAGGAGCILLVLAYCLGDVLLRLMIGPRGPEALGVMLWLLVAEVITIWGMPLEPLLITMRRAGAAIAARSINLLFFLPTLALMIDWYGLGGIGPATAFSTLALIVLQFCLVYQLRNRSGAYSGSAS
ncbi:hypothetical protein AA103196_0196 [Ameyamaea chiangmaiensis NBRC 103196]|nr:hypothetical protein AA103196_0196 [Ameyamaea chiangmaiensis NBRC 103196]